MGEAVVIDAVSHETGDRRSVAITVVLCAAAFVAMLDVFIVNVAFIAIGSSLDAPLSDLSWVLNAYTIVYAALLIPAGRLADRHGRKRAFALGLVVFTVASAACASASTLWLLIVFRAIQAAGAAALTPSSLGLLLTVLPPHRRAGAVKVWATTSSLAGALGPVLGGLLLELSWHWVFLVNLPVGIITLIAAWRLVPDVRDDTVRRAPDLFGALLLAVSVGSLALAIIKARDWGWSTATTIGAFSVAILALVLLARRIARHASPVVDPALFQVAAFRSSNVTALLFCTAFGALFPSVVLWLQSVAAFSALGSGLAIAPGPLMVPIFAAVGQRVARRYSVRAVTIAGNLLFSAGVAMLALSTTAHASYATQILPGWLVTGMGIGLALPNLIAAATASLPPTQAATGSAVINTSRQLGYVLGVAMLVAVLGAHTAGPIAFRHAWWLIAVTAAASAVTAIGIRAPTILPRVDRATEPLSRRAM